MSTFKVDTLQTWDGTKTIPVADILAPSGGLVAGAVANTPAGTISSTSVQDAINELDSEKFPKAGGSLTGDVTLTGNGRRIMGLFGATPVSTRTLFQTSEVNGSTTVGLIPNGTGDSAYYSFSNSSDPNNAAYGYIGCSSTSLVITSTSLGSGVKLPISIDGRLEITTGGDVLSRGGALGYGPGAGGTATQPTSLTGTVTLNKSSGQITMFGAVGVGGAPVFIVNNSTVAAGDLIVACLVPGTGLTAYSVEAEVGQAGLFRLCVRNVGGGTYPAPVIQFNVFKGSKS